MSKTENEAILRVLGENPHGITMAELIEKIGSKNVQCQRRVRQLYETHDIERVRRGRDYLYILKGPRDTPREQRGVGGKLRAEVLHRDRGRCQMCGRGIATDEKLVLQVDHKVPREWGGTNEKENLQALCKECNQGKRAFFASFDASQMREVMHLKSVHERLARLLMLSIGTAIDPDVLEVVAGGDGFQNDWKKRIRELRYTGLEVEVVKRKVGKRTVASYRATNTVTLPPDLTRWIRKYEMDRERRNRRSD